MLSRSSKTSRTATIPATPSVHPLQEYIADLHSKPPKDFPDINDEDGEENGEHDSSSPITPEKSNGETDFKPLMSNKNFEELFQQLFVVGHKQLVVLRSKILLDRKVNPDTLITPSDINAHKIQAIRNQLYKLQMTFFRSPKGMQYDEAL